VFSALRIKLRLRSDRKTPPEHDRGNGPKPRFLSRPKPAKCGVDIDILVPNRSEIVVRLVLFSAAIALFALPFPAQARIEGVPRLAVERSCHAAETYGLTDPEQTYKSCMLDEDEAKGTLEKNWSSYKSATKRDCLTAGSHPSPSYVELLTCIEMTEEILVPANGEGGSGGSYGGGAGALGSPPPRPALSPGPRAMPR
jgi:hypothetical protein